MIIILQLIGVAAAITVLITFLGMKLVEWWECRK